MGAVSWGICCRLVLNVLSNHVGTVQLWWINEVDLFEFVLQGIWLTTCRRSVLPELALLNYFPLDVFGHLRKQWGFAVNSCFCSACKLLIQNCESIIPHLSRATCFCAFMMGFWWICASCSFNYMSEKVQPRGKRQARYWGRSVNYCFNACRNVVDSW